MGLASDIPSTGVRNSDAELLFPRLRGVVTFFALSADAVSIVLWPENPGEVDEDKSVDVRERGDAGVGDVDDSDFDDFEMEDIDVVDEDLDIANGDGDKSDVESLDGSSSDLFCPASILTRWTLLRRPPTMLEKASRFCIAGLPCISGRNLLIKSVKSSGDSFSTGFAENSLVSAYS